MGNPKINRAAAPRLNVELREDQFDALRALLPHGHRKQVFQAIIDDLIEFLGAAKNREELIAAIVVRMIRMSDVTFAKEHCVGQTRVP